MEVGNELQPLLTTTRNHDNHSSIEALADDPLGEGLRRHRTAG